MLPLLLTGKGHQITFRKIGLESTTSQKCHYIKKGESTTDIHAGLVGLLLILNQTAITHFCLQQVMVSLACFSFRIWLDFSGLSSGWLHFKNTKAASSVSHPLPLARGDVLLCVCMEVKREEMWAVASPKLLKDMAASSQPAPGRVGHQRAPRTQRQRGDAQGMWGLNPKGKRPSAWLLRW